jgi:threonine aldolase
VIDLRSDTLTKPSAGMREAMASAEVGDDVFAEDPTIKELEASVARLLGKEAGLFCVSGTLSNLLGVWSLVSPGQEILCDIQAHIVRAEMGGHAALHGVTTRTWFTEDGIADPAQIATIIRPDAGPYQVSTAAIELENTHNFGGGTVQPLPVIQEIRALCLGAGVKMHLDGARLWNAHVATGVALAEYATYFDTVSVCFSKGLGAPIGSMLLSDADTIARARIQRKRLGAGWRQAGVLAAAALYAVEHHIARLAEDHAAAKALAAEVAERCPGAVDPAKVATNIVVIDTGSVPAGDAAARAAAAGVLIHPLSDQVIRAVTHLDVSHGECVRAGQVLGEILGGQG